MESTSIDTTIIELARQLALLKAENERLLSEKVNATINRPTTKAKKSKKAFAKWANGLYEEKYSELCEKYKDDISAVQQRFPKWEPPKGFFDIEG